MGKFSELDKEEKRKLTDEVEAKAQSMGLGDGWEHPQRDERMGLKDILGLCANCVHLEYARTEYGNIRAFCSRMEFRISGKQKIVECTRHSPKGEMTLQDAWSMAWILTGNKNKIGF